MGLLLFIVGAVFGVIFILNNLVRTIRRQYKLTRLEVIWAFFATLLPVSGLLVDNLSNARFDLVEQIAFLLIIPLAIFSIGLTVVEAFRPQRLRQSRGLFGLGIAFLLLVANLSYNFISLNIELSSAGSVRLPTPVNVTDARDPCAVAAEDFGVRLLAFITEATGLSDEELLDVVLSTGEVSAADLVRQNDNDPEQLIRQIVDFGAPAVQKLVQDGCLPAAQGALFISQFRTIVSFVVNSDINTLQNFIGQNFGVGGGDTADLSPEELQATRVALVQSVPTGPPAPSSTPTITPTHTPSPTLTRTPRPTLSPTPTRERFSTATPSPSPTLPNPCLGTASFNVNLRDYPSLENTEILKLIPFDTAFAVYGPNEERTWWYIEYDGVAGWVSSEFIQVTRACETLPARFVPPRLR